jgi:putative ABC transport system permease protein
LITEWSGRILARMVFERLRHSLAVWIRATLRRGTAEREMDEEIRYHVEQRIEGLVDAGMERPAARQRALREFGGLELAREQCRDARRVPILETVVHDSRYALRTLRRNPGYASIAIATLALGIGANSAIFSLVDGILVRPLPYTNPERLVSITGTYPNGAFVAMREQVRSIDAAAYAEGHEMNLTGLGPPVRLIATRTSAELLSILGVRPAIGRIFGPGEDRPGQNRYVILSQTVWERQFSRDPAIVGRPITLEGASYEVIGVMAADFRFPSARTDVWIPIDPDAKRVATYWAGDFMPIVARLRPGASVEQATADVRAFQTRVTSLFPWPMPASWNADLAVVPLQTDIIGNVRARLLVLLGVVALVLLIACVNVANLTLARGAARTKEMGIRTALGAARQRIAQQLLTESVVVALLGGLVGLLLAAQGLPLLKRVLPPDTPRLWDAQLDWRVVAFTGLLSLTTGLIFGVVPALQASRGAVAGNLAAGGRGAGSSVSQLLRRALVIAEVALAVMLVVAAALLVRSFWTLSQIDTGFRPEQVVTARITPSQPYCRDVARCLSFYQRALEDIEAAPGVRGAALTNTPPLGGRVAKRSLNIPGLATPVQPLIWLNIVTPDYFRVMKIPVVRGRTFVYADTSGNPPVAIVSAATAERFWPGEDALGKQVQFVGEQTWHTIVGIAADVRAFDMQRDVPPWMRGTLYVPFSPRATLEDGRIPSEMTIAVATAADAAQIGAMVRRTVAGISQDVPVSEVETLGNNVAEAMSAPASLAVLVGSFAGLALMLGMIGIYGVLSFLVSKRTREIGIRLALGARRADVLWSVMREGVLFAATGIALGLAAALAAARVLSGELYGVSPLDPTTYVAVAALMMMVTVLACCVPTYRATRVDPLIALREE